MLEAVLADDSIAVKRYRNVPLDAASRLILATGINEAMSGWDAWHCRSAFRGS
jgi:hypothetical protein